MAIAPVPRIDFSALPDMLGTYNKAYEAARRSATLVEIADSLKKGTVDYGTAAGKLMEIGEAGGAFSLLKMAEEARKVGRQEAAGREFSSSISGFIGGGEQPQSRAQILSGVGRPKPAVGGVHVAENEADVLRLERATGMRTDPADVDRVVRTVYGEAANEPEVGQQAVAGVIMNRADQSGMTPSDVVLARGQFEPWGDPAGRARMEALDQNSPAYRRLASSVAPVMRREADPSGGAGHFYAPTAQAALGRPAPSWDDGTGQDIGNHRFFAHGYAPGKAARPVSRDVAEADVPASGAAAAQGFFVPGTTAAASPIDERRAQAVVESANRGNITQRISRLTKALSNPHLPEGQRQVGLTFLREAIDSAKAPDGVKEFLWARGNGMTQARNPAEYEREKKGPPTEIQEFEYGQRNPSFAQRQLELKRASAQNITVGGGSDKQIFDTMGESATMARAAATGLNALREARVAVEGGMVSGVGADINLGLRRVASALGADASKVVNTETFRSAIAPQIAAMMKATVGTVQISNADREFAEKAAGGSITLNEGTIRRLLDIMERANSGLIETHQKRLEAVYPASGNFGRERALFGVEAPAGGGQQGRGEPVRVRSPAEARQLPSGTPIILPDGSPGRVP